MKSFNAGMPGEGITFPGIFSNGAGMKLFKKIREIITRINGGFWGKFERIDHDIVILKGKGGWIGIIVNSNKYHESTGNDFMVINIESGEIKWGN